MTKLRPAAVAPYFLLAALVHAGAIAARFDRVAAELSEATRLAILLSQFPVLMLSGYIEGRLDYGERFGPRWMQIRSAPVKLAFTLALILLAVVIAQTWDLQIGPLNPSPPADWPTGQRALWFTMFTVGMYLPFFMLASGVLIPVLRFLTAPLRRMSPAPAAILALAVGGAIGVGAISLVTSTEVGAFIASIRAAIDRDPALLVGVTLALVLGPLLVSLVLSRKAG